MSAIANIMSINAYAFSISVARPVPSTARSPKMLAEAAAAIEPITSGPITSGSMLAETLLEENDDAFEESSLSFKISFRSTPPENDAGLSCWLHPDGERWMCVEDFSLWESNSESLEDSY